MIELRRTLGKPTIVPGMIRKSEAGRMINHLLSSAEFTAVLPVVKRSADPDDDFLLAMAEAGRADFLVTGDKSDLLSLLRHAGTRIITAREFADLI